jgi:hypothetical protein
VATIQLNADVLIRFDDKRLLRFIDKGVARNMARTGALIRGIARRSIKTRKIVTKPLQKKLALATSPAERRAIWNRIRARKKTITSVPGNPPIAHRSGLGIRTIEFAYDPRRRVLYAGGQFLAWGKRSAGVPAPGVQEYGGPVVVSFKDRRRMRRGRPLPTVRKRANVSPRPHMRPAMKVANTKFRTIWKDSITG